ncbi:Uncharacterized conserved protein YehS, DUF1456 family [Colwellia chukchiensis]|uniref:Uncharacterized conserved protein YehS, DUF1456 family n=1 Tax=Colwellia chukchiensis TaxID=641665 RepID=A0A1H7T3G9_9GAMM|nr:DUF1456 family protein [Colwellia chukchiensis]SEL78804.1 Uncharacterized conserved protein YehS, DUF1456 family [Colwellia chukchiensis]
MTNNEVLQHVRYIFALSNEQLAAIFQLAQCPQSDEAISQFLLKNGDPAFRRVPDNVLASFLDGLIIEQRGVKDGAQAQLQQTINNNSIFNKVKIALALKADDIIAVLAAADLTLSKHELSAFFRKVEHKHYRSCSDETLLKFFNGLHLQHQHAIKLIKE